MNRASFTEEPNLEALLQVLAEDGVKVLVIGLEKTAITGDPLGDFSFVDAFQKTLKFAKTKRLLLYIASFAVIKDAELYSSYRMRVTDLLTEKGIDKENILFANPA